uniref:non-specific serine/threonine protein kinase n=1 Tax=Kalanchoe fedtschenkoi TaxID=63787 RepID=A0A7N0V7W1_KALFE
MGNCFGSSRRVDASQTTVGPSKQSTCNSQYTVPSSLVDSSVFSDKSFETNPTPRSEWEILSCPNLKAFTFIDLRNATRNFRSDNLLGEGGFGYVYKGWLDEQTLTATKPGSGMIVAVKKLKPEGFQGHKEWLTEVDYLGQLDHENLVKLVGYCSEGGPQPLSWALRMKVALGAARGLSFLHDSQVIFRDFKASNILLDGEFNAKLSDFGLARAGPTGDKTHVSTQVVGTQGYAAPEYIATGRLTLRCDIYSFGVFLIELLSGRRALDKSRSVPEQNLADWARPHLGDKRKLYKIMDAKLEGHYPKKGAHAVSTLAMVCTKTDARQRPTMPAVLDTLEQIAAAKYSAKYSHSNPEAAPTPVPKAHRQLRSPLNLTPVASPRQLRIPVSMSPKSSTSPLPLLSPRVH